MISRDRPDAAKKVHIKTYGCQMNVYDSRRIADLLAPIGYAETETAEDADLVVLNTCHIREKAAEKVYSDLGRLRLLKEARADREMSIAVAGCVAQAEGAEISARAPVVDYVLGPQSYHRLPELIARNARRQGRALETDFDVDAKFDALADSFGAAAGADDPAAFLTIQEGCDKFCTFCVVPYTRGAEVSRQVAAIECEARALAARGVREVTLLGQNVNAWRAEGPDGDIWGLGELCRHLATIDGIDRIRFTTSHPRDMDDGLIAALGEEPKLMPYLHLPVQSGSDRILKAMNRGHAAEAYVRLIERIRAARPDVAISGDFIVGFPGEDETDFNATLELVREVSYASSFSFKFSRRPGTPGAALPRQVDEAAKADRLARLQVLLEAQRVAFNESTVGESLPVLFEKAGRNEGQLIGRSPYLQSVHAHASAQLIGEIVTVRIEATTPNALAGRLLDDGQHESKPA
ncbi:MAG: tRNA (N6-isopentenyl adenosine(37)-C2)-methylthiotransferase MiaB [Alphaproteobacteria bacterium]|nr:tRNA (N6-isopentenyl adenosine(37)-C2)-methylthiotransferase MiaB [Alphaproteobacteria bacterium]